ncbi:Acetyltransferase (GNAT) domain protein [uncultured archaeon]|nr:Acetyltransferase (GNAT) domain protein [uncultured archaeon]
MAEKKLSLQTAAEEDAEFICKMMLNKEYQKHYLERLLHKSVEEAKIKIRESERDAKKGKGFFFIVLLGKKKIGVLDIYKINSKDKRASIGYGIMNEEWGKGLGTKICALGVKYAKNNLKLHTLEATADPNNEASRKVLEKNGFVLLGTVKDYYFDRGKYTDRDLYWKVLE